LTTATQDLRSTGRHAIPRTWVANLGWELPLILLLVIAAFAVHGANLFHYPAFQEDEGIYAAQAWSVLRDQRLTPYTYTYDHAPGGWIFAAFWMLISGGPEMFGGSILSGRIFILVLMTACVPLLYRIARKLGCGVAGATVATLLFSLSPLAIGYQRMFLLDNIMIFWVLLSINLMLDGWGRLSRLVMSGVCFGIAVLTKETAIFLIPAMLYIATKQRWSHQGRFAVTGWLVPAIAVTSLYPLYAALKGELTGGPGASLIDALRWQTERGPGGELGSPVWDALTNNWLPVDPLLIVGGAAAVAINLIAGLKNKLLMACGLLGLMPLIYLLRGGVVFDFYIVVAIPFLALNIGTLLRSAPRLRPIALLVVAGVVAGTFVVTNSFDPDRARALVAQRPGKANQEAVAWIKANVEPKSYIVARDDFWADLREEGLMGPAFPNVHSHWKVAADPAVRDDIFENNWKRVDYLIMTPGLRSAFEATENEVALEALDNSDLARVWTSDSYRVELWKVDRQGSGEIELLDGSYEFIADRFEQDGAFVDAEGIVTSEAQAYALLRAAWSDRPEDFRRIWEWTEANLQRPDGLLSWQWQDGEIVDANSASDADTDAALALLLAGEAWDDEELLAEGRVLAHAIWEGDVAEIGGTPYLTAGNWAVTDEIVMNPSYLAPYAYRFFAEVDPEHDWYALIDSSYEFLFETTSAPLDAPDSAGLPPDWIALDPATGESTVVEVNGRDATNYGYDAARTWWRVALDLQWADEGRAKAYLDQAGFLADEVERKGHVSAVYEHDGTVVEAEPSIVSTAGATAALAATDPEQAGALYASDIVGRAQDAAEGTYWNDETDLYAQEWGWFATALYGDALWSPWDNASSG